MNDILLYIIQLEQIASSMKDRWMWITGGLTWHICDHARLAVVVPRRYAPQTVITHQHRIRRREILKEVWRNVEIIYERRCQTKQRT